MTVVVLLTKGSKAINLRLHGIYLDPLHLRLFWIQFLQVLTASRGMRKWIVTPSLPKVTMRSKFFQL
ncbi:unnamed protein product, partial [Iphiclides podalirius]